MKIFRKKTSEKFAKRARISFVMAMIFGLSFQLASAWTDPSAAAPGGNVGAPITTGSADQTRAGDLKIGDVDNKKTDGNKGQNKDGILDVDDVWIRDADDGNGGKGAWASQIVSKLGYAPGFVIFNQGGSCKGFTVPDNVYSVNVQIWGAGGGGSYGTARYRENTYSWHGVNFPYTDIRYSIGGSGGSGAYSSKNIIVSPGQIISACIGKGGPTSPDKFRYVKGFGAYEGGLSGAAGEAGDGTKTRVNFYDPSGLNLLSWFEASGGTGGTDGGYDNTDPYTGIATDPINCSLGSTSGDGADKPTGGDVNIAGQNGVSCDDLSTSSSKDYVGTGSSLECISSGFGPKSCTQLAPGGYAIYGSKRFDNATVNYAFGKGGNGSGLDWMPYKCANYNSYASEGGSNSNQIGHFYGRMAPVTDATIPEAFDFVKYTPKNAVAGGVYYTGYTPNQNYNISVRCEPNVAGPIPMPESGEDGAVVISWGEK